MAMWRCPHCGTPQAEAARCWVCHRSSTSCGTCRHFRRSVAAGVGYCGLDGRRAPLQGDEIKPCWEGAESVPLDFAARLATLLPEGPSEADTVGMMPVVLNPEPGAGLWAEPEG